MIAQMERIEVLCLLDVLPEMVAFLQEQGVLHVEDVPLAVEGAPGLLQRVRLTDAEKEERDLLEQIHRMLAEAVPLLVTKPGRDRVLSSARVLETLPQGAWMRKARAWSREVRSLTRRRLNIQDNMEVLAEYRRMLGIVEPLLGTRHVVLGDGAQAIVLKGDVSHVGQHLERRFQRALGVECEFVHRRLDRNALVGIVLYPKGKEHAVDEILQDENIAPLHIPDRTLHGLAFRALLKHIETTIPRLSGELAELKRQLQRFADENGAELTAMCQAVSDRLAQLRFRSYVARSEMLAVVHGWVPATRGGAFETAVTGRFPNEACLTRLPIDRVERKRIPTLLDNRSGFEPFEVLLSLLKPPTYGTIDPSALVGIFFVFFYGFIIGDIAYGGVVILLAYLLRRYFGYNRQARAASAVATYAGASAVIFGALFGEFCGDLGSRLWGLEPLWFHRGHDVMTFLTAALIIGAVHVSLSLVMAIWSKVRRGEREHAMETAGLSLGLLAVGAVVLGIMTPLNLHAMIVVGGILLVLGMILLILAVGAMAVIKVLEVISLVSNVLSYSRLMALGIASVALADAANRLATTASSPLVGIPVALAAHVLNVAIGVFSPTLHSLRLNYVEFLPKFYVPEGRKYEPFRKEALS